MELDPASVGACEFESDRKWFALTKQNADPRISAAQAHGIAMAACQKGFASAVLLLERKRQVEVITG